MKKIFISFALFIYVCFANAQLLVNSTGKVGIGSSATNPLSQFTVNTNGESKFAGYIMYPKLGLRVKRTGTQGTSDGFGTAIDALSTLNGISMGAGIRATAYEETATNSGRSIGLWAICGNAASGNNYGVLGQIKGSQNGAAIYGTSSSTDIGIQLGARYAGYFNGPVKVQGNMSVTGTINGVVIGSSKSGDSSLRQEVGDASSMLGGLKANSFYTEVPEVHGAVCDDTDVMDIKEVTYPLTGIEKQVASKLHYGLDADQLAEVFPDLVYDNEDGTRGINYVEMVPILVQAINELKAEITELKGGETKPQTRANEYEKRFEMGENVTLLSLGENKPNPFSDTTTIPVSIPEEVQKAFIYVYDLTGKKLQQVDITARGKQNITLDATALTDGMYLYSLITDGKMVRTRRMIVEK